MMEKSITDQQTFSQLVTPFFAVLSSLAAITLGIVVILGLLITPYCFILYGPQFFLLYVNFLIILILLLLFVIAILIGFFKYWRGTLNRTQSLILWAATCFSCFIPLAQTVYMIQTEQRTPFELALPASFLAVAFSASVCALIESFYCQK